MSSNHHLDAAFRHAEDAKRYARRAVILALLSSGLAIAAIVIVSN
jgi:hypothetical protein